MVKAKMLLIMLPLITLGLGKSASALEALPYDPNYFSLKEIKMDYNPDVDTITTGSKIPKARFYIIISFFEGYSEKFVKETLQPLRNKYENDVQFIYLPNPYRMLDNDGVLREDMVTGIGQMNYALCAAEKGYFWDNLALFWKKDYGEVFSNMSEGISKCVWGVAGNEKVRTQNYENNLAKIKALYKRAMGIPNIVKGSTPAFVIQNTKTGYTEEIFGAYDVDTYSNHIDSVVKDGAKDELVKTPEPLDIKTLSQDKVDGKKPHFWSKIVEWFLNHIR